MVLGLVYVISRRVVRVRVDLGADCRLLICLAGGCFDYKRGRPGWCGVTAVP